MRRTLIGLGIATSLLWSAGSWAGKDKEPKHEKADITSSVEQQLSGKVLKATAQQVTIEYNGAAVPFYVKKDTRFDGVAAANKLTPGEQVRANFTMRSNRNELRSLSKLPSEGIGGTGSEPHKDHKDKERHDHDQ